MVSPHGEGPFSPESAGPLHKPAGSALRNWAFVGHPSAKIGVKLSGIVGVSQVANRGKVARACSESYYYLL